MNVVPGFAVGLDFGTGSVRALVVRLSDGAEVGTGVAPYAHGEGGVILSAHDPHFARQHPADYLEGAATATAGALAAARDADPGFSPDLVRGLGVDTTGSTPLPVDAAGAALALGPAFADHPAALAWLWKDHTSAREAERVTHLARDLAPQALAGVGGVYSSEWYWAKLLRCAETAPGVMAAAHDWVEIADWLPATFAGREAEGPRGICASGHKLMYHPERGWPPRALLAALHPELERIGERLRTREVLDGARAVGTLTPEWASRLGLPPGAAVATGAFDAHLGAVGAGVREGTLVKVMGTSTCDLMVARPAADFPHIPGLCGVVPGSVLPGLLGLEAGQSAVGDLFAWWSRVCGADLPALEREAAALAPGESGLLALDWNNGNRTVLVDTRLSGLLLGQTLQTRPHEVYRALVEATAFGARVIVERLEEYGVAVERVVAAGGIAERSPLVMQTYADVLGRPVFVSRSSQTSALGAAVAAAVAAGAYPTFEAAQDAMCGVRGAPYRPSPGAARVYDDLYGLYRELHDAFGRPDAPTPNLAHVMKRLLGVQGRARAVSA
ncbi:ribulokinase [Deinococcus planocerae]|uniref:ribulokinase n=1 Tax=Deinococcus planocerae TaxID=1737569 RepID=UPI000C7F0145|nr:ribulokinase [Deinococcus planocerae]